MSNRRMFANRAFAWARRQTLDALSARVELQSRQVMADREELACRFEGRACRVRLWAKEAEVDVELSKRLLPDGLRILESSAWGAQKQEAWSSGEAVPTGMSSFDAAFIIVGAEHRRPLLDAVRGIAPPVLSCLVSEREQLRDAEITPALVRLPIRGSRRPDASRRELATDGARAGMVWALGSVFLGLDGMPDARDIEQGLARAARVARALEAAATTA